MRSNSKRFKISLLTLVCFAAVFVSVADADDESKDVAFPEAIGSQYLALSKAIRTRTMPNFMKIFHRDYIFEATDSSGMDRGPWRRLWLDRFEENVYDKVTFELVRVIETSDEEVSLRVRRVVVMGEAGSAARRLGEAILEDSWVKGAPERPESSESWTLQGRTEIEVRSGGALVRSIAREIRSPRIAALSKKMRSGEKGSLSEFWTEIDTVGSPLVEPVSGGKHAIVTFLWRGRGGEHRVRLKGGRPGKATLKPLKRLVDTDLWFRTERLHNDARFTYEFHVEQKVSVPAFGKDPAESLLIALTSKDPLNKKAIDGLSLVELAGAPVLKVLERIDDRPSGGLERQRFTSEVLGETRFVSVYTPPDYDEKGAPYKAAFLLDRGSYGSRRVTRTVLDNLIAEKKIPSLVVFLIHSEGSRRKHLELSDEFQSWVGEEIVAWARENYHISDNPVDNVIGGNGVGATLAAFVASKHGEVFGAVLTESGDYASFLAAAGAGKGHGKSGASLVRRFVKMPLRPLRFYLAVADLEGNPVVSSNRHLRDVLEARGYDVAYVRIAGNHNSRTWNGALASGLVALFDE